MHLVAPLASGITGAASGSAKLYIRGTSTRATWYSDFEASASSTADITLDSYGRAIVYVNGLVRVEVYSGTTLVTSFVAGSNAAAVELISASVLGTDYETAQQAVSKPTTVKAAFDAWEASAGARWPLVDPFDTGAQNLSDAIGQGQGEFLVTKYGATGDGTTNDTAAIVAADAAAVAAGGGTLVFPAGTFRLTAAFTLSTGVSLRGAGAGISIIKIDSATADCIVISGGTNRSISFLSIDSAQANTGDLVQIDNATLRLTGCVLGSSLTDGSALKIGATTAAIVYALACLFQVGAGGTNSCITAGSTSSFLLATSCSVAVAEAGSYGGVLVNVAFVVMSGCRFEAGNQSSGTSLGVNLASSGMATVTGCRFSAPGGGTFSAFSHTLGSSTLSESGNAFGSGVNIIALSSTIADIASSSLNLGSRDKRKTQVDNDTAGAQTVDSLNYGTIVWRRTTNGTQTPTFATAPEGSRFTLIWWNDHGATGGTITLAAASGAIRTEFASDQFTVAANSIMVMDFKSVIINGANRWVMTAESTGDETE